MQQDIINPEHIN